MLSPIPNSPQPHKVIADIGGTNARFALLNSDGVIQDQLVLKGANYPDFVSAFRDYIEMTASTHITEAAVAIANPIDGDAIKMTNHNWDFSIEEARQSLGLDTLVFKNDFEALAMSLPFLDTGDVYKVCGGEAKQGCAIGVLGPGTGLGVSGLVYADGQWVPLSSEGGHASLSPSSDREIDILKVALRHYEHVSAERFVSGPGLKLIYQFICELDGVEPIASISAHEISEHALAETNSQCVEALEVFCAQLGVIAGNLALTLGAKGGIYIGGGIVPKLGDYFSRSPFKQRFVAKGRFSQYLADIPVYVIQAKYPALVGIKQVFSGKKT